jgi:uncharacterized repeat protein (TIGR03803 family)
MVDDAERPVFFAMRRSGAACLLAAGLLTLPASAVAGKPHTLYSFCHSTGCPDGQTPFSGLAMDGNGDLFGTTLFGGNSSDHGTVYELVKKQSGWKFRTLYTFCAQTNCTDGGGPRGAVILDTSGRVYGTTSGGGEGSGVAYVLTGAGNYRIVYNFCSLSNCTDGLEPDAGLTYQGARPGTPYDGVSTLYGNTSGGGQLNGGTVFALTPGGTETVLYNFNPQTKDGHDPEAALTVDSKGNLFGTTAQGGLYSSGTAFEITGVNAETVLHSFCAKTNCSDGGPPASGALLLDAAGDLLGDVPTGGKADGGVLFQLKNTAYKVLTDFCTKSACKKGARAEGALTEDAAGNVFGVAPLGGTKIGNGGVVFEFEGSLRTIYSFCNTTNCPDGGAPYSKVVIDASGNIFGTTTQGGDFNGGTIFEVTP